MSNCTWKRLVSLLLALALWGGIWAEIPVYAADDADVEAQAAEIAAEAISEDGAAFGEWIDFGEVTADILGAWVNRSLSESEMKTLLNSVQLYPQRTGWVELDKVIENLLAQCGGSDTYTKLWNVYNYLVKNVTYSWDGYSYTTASVKCYNSFTKYNYLASMTYEDGLQKSIPDDMANRAYHVLTKKKGVCYDYAIAFAVIARYIGIDSYVHCGRFVFEDASNGAGHHGWCLLTLNGTNYIFDPQRDARNWQYYGHTGYYFGVPKSNASSYQPDYWTADTTANAARDASMLSVSADRAHKVTVTAQAGTGGTVSGGGSYITGNTATLTATPSSGYVFEGWYDSQGNRLSTSSSYSFTVTDDVTVSAKFAGKITVNASASGTASGAGTYALGTTVTLTATPSSGKSFSGWYDANHTLLSTETTYQFTVQKNATYYAMFEGDYFWDVTTSDWYYDEVTEAAQRGITNGVDAITFSGSTLYTRAMAAVMIARAVNADLSDVTLAPFEDTKNLTWGQEEIGWAYANGAITGRTETIFDPETAVTREEFMLIMVRYLKSIGIVADTSNTTLTFSDMDQATYVDAITAAVALGLVQGDSTEAGGTVRPTATLSRAEGTAIVLRMVHLLEAQEAAEES